MRVGCPGGARKRSEGWRGGPVWLLAGTTRASFTPERFRGSSGAIGLAVA